MKQYEKVDTWFDIAGLEKEILNFWEKNKIFGKLVEKNKGNEPWSFLDGPITANNPMGVHHAWGRTLKDVYQRYYAMNGREERYQNGFDCQGLWVEVEVEKELGIKSKKDIEAFGIGKFVAKCKERAKKYSDVITNQSKRLGFWMDWNDSYYTMSDENNYTIWSFLKKVHDKGYIYKGHDVMPWCPRCGTGISQHEMQEGYKETKHLSVIVKFPINGRKNEAFLVWTTTPWTLTSNVAVAVNPAGVYLKVKQNDWIYYIIKSRADKVLGDKSTWSVVEELKGEKLIKGKLTYQGPYDELPAQKDVKVHHKVIPWEEVTEEEGTGIVHIAPGCGAEDHMLGKEHRLPAVAPIDENGIFINGFGPVTGKEAGVVGDEIKADLKNKGILYSSERYLHSYPHCWRCGKELLFRLVDEWFIAMDPWREDIKKVAKKIKWIPSFGLDLELDWLNNMRDWMISKKRYWGLALPIWECDSCKHFEVIGSFNELKERAVEGWDKFEGNSPHRPWVDEVKIKCKKCGKKISRVKDVGNPWLDAGIVPYSTVKYNTDRKYWKKWIPADLVLECFPGQFRNWFYSLLAMSTVMENIPPFRTLVGHALVRDEKGEEMHKSKGNAIWFDDAAEKVGVEVMRWIYCSHELSTNLNFGYESAKLVRGGLINTLWNSYAFFANYARLVDFDWSSSPILFKKRPDFDRWIISKLQRLVAKCRDGFEGYDVRLAAHGIEEFLEVLSNWYIRNNRRRFWRSEMDDDTASAYQTLHEVLFTILKLAAPILPFLTEKIYQGMVLAADSAQPESIHLVEYPVFDAKCVDKELVEDMDNIINITSTALAAREKARIKIKQPLSKLIVAPGNKTEERAIGRFSKLLMNELNVKKVEAVKIGLDCPMKIEIKPERKSLGQKYKAKSKMIIENVEKQAALIARELSKNKEAFQFNVNIDGEDFAIASEDLHVEEISPEGISVVRLNEGWVAFDTVLTEDLILEGMARDFLRRMQVLRKEIGLEMEDRIEVTYSTGSDKVKGMISKHEGYICNELLCLNMKEDSSVTENVIKLGDGEIKVVIKKIEGGVL